MITMPAEFPELFDPQYAALEPEEIDRRNAIALRPKPWVRPVVAGRYPEMVARFGRPIGRFEQGTKWEHLAGRDADPSKQTYGGATDAELRALYGRREAS